MKIAIIGCGNLGSSILNGLLEENYTKPENIIATKRNIHTIQSLAGSGVHITDDNKFAVDNAEFIVIALKPYNILPVLRELKSNIIPGKHTIISVATGITIDQMQEVLGTSVSIFRAMPNTAADVGESLTCICAKNSSNEKAGEVKKIFDSIGETILIDEYLMESATVLGACGIAYVLRFIRGMIQGGIEIGFDARTAREIVTQTVKGAADLLIERNEHPEFEIDKVTTPRGCTIAGLNEMEHHGFSSALIKGIVTSYAKIEKK